MPDAPVRPTPVPDPEEEPPPPDAQVAQLAVGRNHACALTDAGAIYCWGNNEVGQCAAGRRRTQLVPSRVRGIPPVVQVSSINMHTCAVDGEGGLWCWGFSGYDQLGVPASAIPDCGGSECSRIPLRVPDVPPAERVFAGQHGTCAANVTGGVRCWGRDRATGSVPSTELGSWVKLDFGLGHGCALEVAGGALRCFGGDGASSAFGRLGDDDRGDGIVDLERVVDVEVGSDHACALDDTGNVFCWGYDWASVLGRPSEEVPECRFEGIGGRCAVTPRRPTGVPPATAISVGGSRSCLIDEAGGVQCWGAWTDDMGGTSACGEPPIACDPFAEPVAGLESIVAVDAGYSIACALDAEGAVWCWGFGAAGLGDGTASPGLVDLPVRVLGFGP